METKPFYITTAIPYINAKPHLGHVLEWFQADAIAVYQRQLLGKQVVLVSGADENSLKNVQAAEKADKPVQEWLDQYAAVFEKEYADFGVHLTQFRRSSDKKHHWPGVQKLWQACQKSGDIYKKSYQGWYCVGCEAFYTPDELVEGKCPEHLTKPELVEEENYFFRLSKYQSQIKELITSGKLRIEHEGFRNEMLGFVNKGLEDFSVSRSHLRARGVGVPVPEDAEQVIYVWFDALAVYLTAVGWGFDEEEFERTWPADVHVIGKGINRFHSIYWIGMLLSAGLPTPKMVSVHGYLTVDGQKMSKSLGNVIDPQQLAKEIGVEPLRYYLLKEVPTHADGDVNQARLREVYHSDLANGFGNLCSRLAKLASTESLPFQGQAPTLDEKYKELFEAVKLDEAAKWCHAQMQNLDRTLNQEQPWKLQGSERTKSLVKAIASLRTIAFHLQPFIPVTAKKVLDHFGHVSIEPLTPLFARLSEPA